MTNDFFDNPAYNRTLVIILLLCQTYVVIMTQYSLSFAEPCRWHHFVFDQHYTKISILMTPKSNTYIHNYISGIYKISNHSKPSKPAGFKRIRAVFLNSTDNFLTIWMVWHDSKYASIYERMGVHMYVRVHIFSNTVHTTWKICLNCISDIEHKGFIRTISASTKQAAVSWPE